jgi:hypothetical protein
MLGHTTVQVRAAGDGLKPPSSSAKGALGTLARLIDVPFEQHGVDSKFLSWEGPTGHCRAL